MKPQSTEPPFTVSGLSDTLSLRDAMLFRSRIFLAVSELPPMATTNANPIAIQLGASPLDRFPCREPDPSAERLVLADELLGTIRRHIRRYEHRNRLYRQRGLAQIDPHPRTLLHLPGPPGCGKTLVAHLQGDCVLSHGPNTTF